MIKKKTLRILIIDDNPDIHKDFIKILTKQTSAETDAFTALDAQIFGEETNIDQEISMPSFDIDTASQGLEGIALVQKAHNEEKKYALIFVDVRMPPGLDGIETIKKIWQIDPDTQIVICTAYSDYGWRETVKHLGVTDNLLILKKPFDFMAARQLACALTKKWLLMQEAKSHTIALEHYIQDRTEVLTYQVTHDSLTDLPNRALLYDRLEHAISSAERSKSMLAVLFCDLDNFKLINDNFNHATGDVVLQTVAKRMRLAMRGPDTLSRLGGDEFVLIIPNLSSEEDVIGIVNNLLKTVKEPLSLSGIISNVAASIGISLYPRDGQTSKELLCNADLAMYRAKELGGDQFQFFTPELNEKSLSRLQMETELHQAIINKEFFLCYQPHVNLKTEKLVSAEALIRWNHPTLGVMPPLGFIACAEKSGLIIPIGEWVLKTVCAQNKLWQEQNLPPICISVNISVQQLRQANFVSMLSGILAETKLEPCYLGIELNENAFLNGNEIIAVINNIKKIGVIVILDRFGTGNISLNYLRTIPIDYLKIDTSLIQNINKDYNNKVIVEAIINIANSLNLKVIAEGAETFKEVDFLQKHNCNFAQGYYFSKPLPVEELKELLTRMERHDPPLKD